jgi:hypothetical protein
MPIYEFYNKDTDEHFEKIFSYSDKLQFLKDNPQFIGSPSKFGLVSMVGGIDSKTDNTWKEVLNKVAEAHPGSEVGNRYGKKSHKQVKNQTVLEKHRKRLEKKLHG